MKKKILVLCTGNSCRSQMAEGYLRHFAGDRYDVESAGLEPSVVNPKAVRVMQEDGIDISGHASKDVQQFVGQDFDYIITVCDNAKERCPYFPGNAQRIHWSFKDPAEATGIEEEVLDVFRDVRDKIKSTLLKFIEEQNKED
ncbi:arsenate reductase ArsC [candidate division KSB1 bacterium]|nr:arsenate reductase ArsC [candidate division KSB1 bacterium]